MKEYKVSKATYKCDYEDKVLLVNTLNGNLMCSNNQKAINNVFQLIQDTGCVENEDEVYGNLRAKGFIIEKTANEEIVELKRYWDEVYDNRLGITIMPTEQCNCRCPYCYESFSKPKMNEEIVESLILFLQKNLVSHTGLNISWFGGEPLLALDVIEKISNKAIEFCRLRRIMFDSSITTNGVLLTPEVMKRLLACRVNRFQITLDGPRETHDKTRILRSGAGTFDTIINNLLAIKKVKTAVLKINIRVNITQESLKKLPELIVFLHEKFGDDKRFSFYFRPIGDWNSNIENDTLKDSLLSSLESVYKILLDCSVKLNYGILYQMLISPMCFANKKNHFVLGSDGTAYKCTVYFDKEENNIGQLQSDGRILWNEEKIAKWIVNNSNNAKCENCFLAAACHGKGCPAKKLIFGVDTGCGHEMENIGDILKLVYQSNNIHHLYKQLE